jgi:hypothetical protein
LLVDLLESFHFSDLGEQLDGHEELALSFRALLAERIPTFRESLLSILETLNQYLFDFRQIEERAKRVRAFALHLNRHADWEPKDWHEVAAPADWLQYATPLSLQCHPDVADRESEALLTEIARTIPATAGSKVRHARPAGKIEEGPANTVIEAPEAPIRRAVRLFFRTAQKSQEGISAREWWARNPSFLETAREDIWLLRVLAEHDNRGKHAAWTLRLKARRDPVFSGNVLINDVVVSQRAR